MSMEIGKNIPTNIKLKILFALLPLIPIIFIIALTIIVFVPPPNVEFPTGQIGDIPAQFMPFYTGAEKQFGVPWYILAAIHKVETDFSKDLSVSSAGAKGPMQFLESTWEEYKVDGNNDGKYDINDNADAIYSAGNYLAKSGYSSNPDQAIFAYNHAWWYVEKVKKQGAEYQSLAANAGTGTGTGTGSGGVAPVPGSNWAKIKAEGDKYLGMPYVWGGKTPQTGFDCSGFVSWVLTHSGVKQISGSAQDLYDACTPISESQAQPGDLIFFTGTYTPGPTVTHVGFYAGNGTMLDCGKPIKYESYKTPYWQSHFYAMGRLK